MEHIQVMSRTEGVMFLIVFALMVLDFASGTIQAIANKGWDSKIMRQGLIHKCSLLVCIALGVVLNFGQRYMDFGITVPVYQSICVYIALMEAGSVIENVCKANPDLVPEKLRAVLGLVNKDK